MDTAATTTGATPLTMGTLVLIAIGMVCAIAIIWWGTMLRRRRAAAVAEAQEHAELAGHPVEQDTAPPTDQPTGAEPATVLVEPAIIATAPTPVPEAPDTSTLVPSAEPDAASPATMPLTMLKGLGPKAAAQLQALGIDRIDQLAALSPTEAAALDARMGSFTGRLSRDRWIEQARLVSAGDIAGFEAAFGKLGV